MRPGLQTGGVTVELVPLNHAHCLFGDTEFSTVKGVIHKKRICTVPTFYDNPLQLTPDVPLGTPEETICQGRCKYPDMRIVIERAESMARLYNRMAELALNEQTLREQEAATNTAAVSPAPMPSQSEIPADVSARPGAAAR